jgi:NAD(P)-dependent dehydrogenase (short-subunit alcohol dehydrogenase family)
MPSPVHLGRWNQIDGLVDAAYGRFGKVDVLVNNAAISPLYESLTAVNEKLFDAVVNLNLKGPFRLAALLGDRMVATGGGSIINVSSIAAMRPGPEMLPYAAAKAGLNALTEGLALAFGPSVRVNTIQPGAFFADISQAWDMDARSNDSRAQGCNAASAIRDRGRRFVFDVPTRRVTPPDRSCGSTMASHKKGAQKMACNFSTDSEFAEKASWVKDFVWDEVEPSQGESSSRQTLLWHRS